ncbi:hypothetical protein Pyn_28899 [Prunus yedoensis var. nudiflora]|uniref:Uncharacterized protein n=1 Tax=Prunus yedoensis var. nudiflora TaxID=2094558 RepID=A0A315AMF0_PRUYE|nr:hypothetical protein Pyn_28899 [Prunus yedoensis var. nudiflora]
MTSQKVAQNPNSRNSKGYDMAKKYVSKQKKHRKGLMLLLHMARKMMDEFEKVKQQLVEYEIMSRPISHKLGL